MGRPDSANVMNRGRKWAGWGSGIFTDWRRHFDVPGLGLKLKQGQLQARAVCV